MRFKFALFVFIVSFAMMQTASFADAKTKYEEMLEKCKKADTAFDIEGKRNAIKYCTEAISIKPQSSKPYLYRGTYFLSIEDLENAIKDFTTVIELKPSDVVVYSSAFIHRGYCFFLKKQYDEAIADYEKALEIIPDNKTAKERLQRALKEKDAVARIEIYSEKLKANPNDRQNYIELAVAYTAKHDYKKAIEVLDACEAVLKDECKLYNLRGWCKLRIGDRKGAYDDFTRGIKEFSKDPKFKKKLRQSYFERAKTYKFEETDKKIADIKKALEIDPNFTLGLWSLGWAYYESKGLVKNKELKQQALRNAISAFSRLIELDPKYDVRIYRFRAKWNMLLDIPNCVQAIKDRKMAAEMSAEETLHLAETYSKCRRYNESIHVYEKEFTSGRLPAREYYQKIAKVYLRQAGVDIVRMLWLGDLSRSNEHLQKALAYFKKAAEYYSCKGDRDVPAVAFDCMRKADIYGYIGIIYHGWGNKQKALKAYTNAINYNFLTARARRAFLFYEMKRFKEALEDCERSSPFDTFGACNDEFKAALKERVETSTKKRPEKSPEKGKPTAPQKRLDKVW